MFKIYKIKTKIIVKINKFQDTIKEVELDRNLMKIKKKFIIHNLKFQ